MPLSGKTPMVKINYLYEGQKQHLYAKLEAYNPSGSIKDRVAEHIVERAEKSGELKPGRAIIEVTSGNTGIAFASIGARKGYNVHIFMPSWVSEERKKIIRMYGATVHEVTREEGGFSAAFDKADDLARRIDAYMPHQFENIENVNAHELYTGREIVQQLPTVTDFVSGIGTGGTLMGVAAALRIARKRKNNSC
jgi:Cysteine synthase